MKVIRMKALFTGCLCFAILTMFAFESKAQDVKYPINIRYGVFQNLTFTQLSEQSRMLMVKNVENREINNTKPQMNAGRIAGEIILGGITGATVGFTGMLAGAKLASMFCNSDENDTEFDLSKFFNEISCYVEFILVGGFAGYTIGTPIGVYLIGNVGNQKGSFMSALGGSAIGMLTGVMIAKATDRYTGFAESIGVPSFLVLPVIFSTVAFNLTRKYESLGASRMALINYVDSKFAFKFPTIYYQRNSSNHLDQKADLIKIVF